MHSSNKVTQSPCSANEPLSPIASPTSYNLSPQNTHSNSVSLGFPSESPTPPPPPADPSDEFDISPYCIGTPHHIGESSSGSIHLMLSLQEPTVFLPCPQSFSPSSYREHDNGTVDPFPRNAPPVNDPLNENYSPPSSFSDQSPLQADFPPHRSDSVARDSSTSSSSYDTHTNRHSSRNTNSSAERSSSRGWLHRRNDSVSSQSSSSSSSESRNSNTENNGHSRPRSRHNSVSDPSSSHRIRSGSTDNTDENSHIPKYVSNLLDSSLSPTSTGKELPPAVLRGSLVMKLSKPTKIKGVSLRFYGKCKTGWLEANYSREYGITLPHGPEFQNEVLINSHTWEYIPNPPNTPPSSSVVNLDGYSIVSSDLYGADIAYIKPTHSTSAPSSNILSRTLSNNSSYNANTSSPNSSIPTPALKYKTPIPPPANSSNIERDDQNEDSDEEKNSKSSHIPGFFGFGKNRNKKKKKQQEDSKKRSHSHHHHHHHHQNRSSSVDHDKVSINQIPYFSPLYFNPKNASYNKSQGIIVNNSPPTLPDTVTVYPAGDYVFNFTLAIDPRTAETIRCPNGNVRYYLVARVSRSSRFSFATTGHTEINLVRSPPSSYDSTSNSPIAISRNWDNRLHYEIVCPRKYIPLGTSIPMSIKLTPIDKVQVHRIRISVVETVNYICAKSNVLQHTDPVRRVVLFQKKAKPSKNNTKNASSIPGKSDGSSNDSASDKGKKKNDTTPPGDLLSYMKPSNNQKKRHDRNNNNNDNSIVTIDNEPNELYEDLISTTTNIECSIPFVSREDNWDSIASHHFINPASDSRYLQFLRPDATHNPYIHVKHRLHVAFRISKKDPDDPKRRYFEVLIDTPIFFLSKHCKNENIDLPLYDSIVGTSAPNLNVLPSNNANEYMSIPATNAITIPSDMGSPLVRSVSSEMSPSPLYDSFLSYDRLPSFDDVMCNNGVEGSDQIAPSTVANNRLESSTSTFYETNSGSSSGSNDNNSGSGSFSGSSTSGNSSGSDLNSSSNNSSSILLQQQQQQNNNIQPVQTSSSYSADSMYDNNHNQVDDYSSSDSETGTIRSTSISNGSNENNSLDAAVAGAETQTNLEEDSNLPPDYEQATKPEPLSDSSDRPCSPSSILSTGGLVSETSSITSGMSKCRLIRDPNRQYGDSMISTPNNGSSVSLSAGVGVGTDLTTGNINRTSVRATPSRQVSLLQQQLHQRLGTLNSSTGSGFSLGGRGRTSGIGSPAIYTPVEVQPTAATTPSGSESTSHRDRDENVKPCFSRTYSSSSNNSSNRNSKYEDDEDVDLGRISSRGMLSGSQIDFFRDSLEASEVSRYINPGI